MVKDFEPMTREKANGETRVLIMDGHGSHYTADLLEFAKAHNIKIIGYPPHCTHALQGLDVVCFARMKECWKDAIDAFEEKNKRGVAKEDFVTVFGCAFVEAFKEETILAAFSATGVHPFDRSVIKPVQMQPSQQTSTVSTFPLPQPSPVRAVMAAFRDYRFENTGTGQSASTSSTPSSPSRNASLLTPSRTGPSPLTPSRTGPATPKRLRDPASNPDMPTPSKRMRLLEAGLRNTTSGSFLVGKAKATHACMSKLISPPIIEKPPLLPVPNWNLLQRERELDEYSKRELMDRVAVLEDGLGKAQAMVLAREAVIEGQSAQMVIQAMGMEKMNRTLHEKEKGKSSEKTILFPGGKGRHLTSDEVITKKRELENAKADKAAASKRRRLDQAQRKVDNKAREDAIEAAWSQAQQDHTEALKRWEEECAELKSQGMWVKDLPKRPGRVFKKDVVAAINAEDTSDRDEELESDHDE